MFKNYLTFQFAQSFDRACRAVELAPALKRDLVRGSQTMLEEFSKSLDTEDSVEEAKLLFSALIAIRNCRALLEAAGIAVWEIDSKYAVLYARLEQLCAAAAQPKRPSLQSAG